MSSGFHWFLPICKHSSHFERTEMALDFLAVQRMSFRPCRCSEQSVTLATDAVSEGRAVLHLPAAAALSSSACKGSFRQFFFTGSLGSYTISSDCSQNYWWKAGIPLGFSGGEPSGTAYAVLRLPRNGPVGVGCCPSMASALALRLFFSPAVWVKIWVYYGHLPIFQSCLAAEKTLAAVEVIQPGMWAQCKPDCLCGMNLWLWKLAVAISIFLAFNLKNTQWQIIAVNIQS